MSQPDAAMLCEALAKLDRLRRLSPSDRARIRHALITDTVTPEIVALLRRNAESVRAEAAARKKSE